MTTSTGRVQRGELTRTLWSLRSAFARVGVFSLVVNLLMLAPTIYMLQVYDRVLASRSELTLLALSLITLVLLAVLAASEAVRSRVLVRAGLRFDQRLSSRVFRASFGAVLGPPAAAPSRAFGDLIELRQFLMGPGIFALCDAPWSPLYIGVLFLLHPWLGVLAIGFVLIQAALAWLGHRRTVAPLAAASATQAEAMAYLQSKLRHSEVIESMGMLGNLRQRWARRHQDHLARQDAALGLTGRVTAFSKFVRYAQQSLALGGGALLVIDGQLSPGAMIAANVLMTRALAPIDQLVSAWRGFVGARDAFVRLGTLLDAHPERHRVAATAIPSGAVSVSDVVAQVPGRAAPLLDGVSLSVPAGTVTVVLGPSGSGKSTLARVLVGLWPCQSGRMLLDGRPIDQWSRTELGPHIGYLPQDVELFEGSIAENIARFGAVDAVRVIEAARAAGLHETILRFPKGYDTPVGAEGGVLSGGQRQRIGLARALHGDPALVVLDEPNANLDDAGEAALLAAVRGCRERGRTVFLISHRPGIVEVADRLLILREGRVQLEGPRDAVIAALKSAEPAVLRPEPLQPEPVSSAS